MLPIYYQSRCKALISQFNVKKVKTTTENEDASENWEDNDPEMAVGANARDEEDDTDGLIGLIDEMEPDEWAVHEMLIHPVKLVLTKVRLTMCTHCFIIILCLLQIQKLAFRIINSTTKLL